MDAPVGWQAFETARIEAGIPRFGADMDETNLPLECGIESRRRELQQRLLHRPGSHQPHPQLRPRQQGTARLAPRRPRSLGLPLPQRGDKLFRDGKEIGYITSAVKSPALNANIALGYVRREANQIGTELVLRTAIGENSAKIVELPFVK